MGLEERVAESCINGHKADCAWTVSVHTFSDITNISPVVFLYLLKECYIHGTCKATRKFRALQQQVSQALCNSPEPGPATFIVRCLYVLPIFGVYSEGFSHLIISALRRHQKTTVNSADSTQAKEIAAYLFLDITGGFVDHDEKLMVKILEAFDVRLTDIEKAITQLKAQNEHRFDTAKTVIEQYIFAMIDSQSYMTAVSLLEHFSIRQSGESFLLKMIQNKEFKAAEKWATFMGKPMLCLLVQQFVDRNMLKSAYDTIKKNDLQQDFPDVYHKCKENLLKRLAEKACWDIAEAKTKGDKRLLEYLVYLAMEAGYSEKVDELCERYSLEGFFKTREPEAGFVHSRFLHLKELVVEDIIWVDEVDGLHKAICHIEGCKVVGIDCEWKPNYVKGCKMNKVIIFNVI